MGDVAAASARHGVARRHASERSVAMAGAQLLRPYPPADPIRDPTEWSPRIAARAKLATLDTSLTPPSAHGFDYVWIHRSARI
jgi:hypothetical protein